MDESQLIAKLFTGQNGLIYAVLIVFGMTLKKTPFVPDWLIPYILGITGMGIGFGMNPSYEGILIGFVLAGLSVYGHQLVSQYGKSKEIPPSENQPK